jgi:hypothetical protein
MAGLEPTDHSRPSPKRAAQSPDNRVGALPPPNRSIAALQMRRLACTAAASHWPLPHLTCHSVHLRLCSVSDSASCCTIPGPANLGRLLSLALGLWRPLRKALAALQPITILPTHHDLLLRPQGLRPSRRVWPFCIITGQICNSCKDTASMGHGLAASRLNKKTQAQRRRVCIKASFSSFC